MNRLSQENEELRRRLNDLQEANRKISEYESKIVTLSHELERVNGNLRLKMDENNSLEQKNRAYVQEIDNLNRRVGENEIMIVQEWQTKVTRITHENDDLRNQLNRLNQDNEELKRRLSDLGEVNRKVAEYENRIALMSQEI